MRRVIFLFLDGVGIGDDDGSLNPLAAGEFPCLDELLGGRKAVAATGRSSFADAELIPTDAHLGVPGRPQSATGQTAIVTGINAPGRLGEHYGPRPDARIRALLDEGSLFRTLQRDGLNTYFCNAYPAGFFAAVKRGKRRLSAVPYAATVGGQKLPGIEELVAGSALAANFTNQGWQDSLGYVGIPVYEPEDGGRLLWEIADDFQFVFFEHWMTDLLGHRKLLHDGIAMLQRFDRFLAGLLAAMDPEETMVIVGSDHGNLEDCSHGKHTENPALTLLLGAGRKEYATQLRRLTDYAPIIRDFLSR